MMRNIIHIICVFAALLVPALAGAQIVRKDSVPLHWAENNKKVIVDGDTVSMIIPERNYGRYDRGLFNYLYLPKGDWASDSRHHTANSTPTTCKCSRC